MVEAPITRENPRGAEQLIKPTVVYHRTLQKYWLPIANEGLRPHKLVTLEDKGITWEEKMLQMRRQAVDGIFDIIPRGDKAAFTRKHSVYAYLTPKRSRPRRAYVRTHHEVAIIALMVDPAQVLVANMDLWQKAWQYYLQTCEIWELGETYWATTTTLADYRNSPKRFARPEVLVPPDQVLGFRLI